MTAGSVPSGCPRIRQRAGSAGPTLPVHPQLGPLALESGADVRLTDWHGLCSVVGR